MVNATSRKKRILYFHHAIGLGGAPKSLSLLIDGLDKSRFEPIVVMPKRPNNQVVANMFREAGAEVVEERDIRPFNGSTVAPCATLRGRAYAVLSINKLVKAARTIVSELEPDIVHLNSTCLVGAAKGAHLANSKLPVIAHVREPLLPNWWGRCLARMNRKHVNWFIGIDQFGLDSIGTKQSRGDVIYNFVDLKQLTPPSSEDIAKLKEERNWQDKTVFLSLSRVSKSNGALELGNLVVNSKNSLDQSAHFVIAGFANHGPYENEVKELLQNEARFQLLDFERNVIDLISAADVIIAPFTTAHSARSVFEGAAMSKPSLVSDLPNLCELIKDGETGFKFDLADPTGFSKSVNQLCDTDLRNQFALNARTFAEEKFDQVKNVQKTIGVYERLLKT